MSNALLEIRDLTVKYVTMDGTVHAVTDVSLTIEAGETLGLVGETGAGKTTTALSILNLLPTPPAKITKGEILFDGKNVLEMSDHDIRQIRGSRISMIFQDPMSSLNPLLTIGEQISETYLLHNKITKAEAKARTLELLAKVGIQPPEKRYEQYQRGAAGRDPYHGYSGCGYAGTGVDLRCAGG